MTPRTSRTAATARRDVRGRSPGSRSTPGVTSPHETVAPETRPWARPDRLIPLVLLGAGVAVYWNSLAGAFLLDDHSWIVDNPQIRRLWPPWHAMAGNSRPVVQLSVAVNYALGGLNVRGYHALNLIFHLLAGLVLFDLLRRTLQSERLRARYGPAAPWLAMSIALIWIVHPLETESVTYVIQRAESLMGLFFLLTIYGGVRGARSSRPLAWYALAVVTCSLGMASKEVMVVAPLVMLLYDRIFLAASFADAFRRRWGLYLGLAAGWVLLGVLLATRLPEQQIDLVARLPPWRYALTQAGVIVHYLRLAVWPDPLILDYAWPPVQTVSSALLPALMLLALLAGTLVALRHHHHYCLWLGFWGAWFFLILAPTSSLFPIADLAFEHRMYLPLAGVIAIIVVGVHEGLGLLARGTGTPPALRRWMGALLTVAAVSALGCATVERNEDYRSEVKIWHDTVMKRPGNPRAHLNLGFALQRQGDLDGAIERYRETLRLKPDYAEAHNDLGSALERKGRDAEALPHLEMAVRLNPLYALAYNNLAIVLAHEGKIEEAIVRFTQALRVKPDFALAHGNLAIVLADQGRLEEAIAHLSEVVRLEPDSPAARRNLKLAQARLQHGKPGR
jgi:tetratricopeptide (TPR) repeat protein